MTIGTIGAGTESTVELSVQARLEQLEGAIAEAHEHVDKMEPRPSGEDQVVQNGVVPTLVRCQQSMSELNLRLQNLAEKLGEL